VSITIFEEDKDCVREALQQGDFDYIDTADAVFETEFFRYIRAQKILQELAGSYPTPRRKHEVPLWLFLASNLTLRLHGEQAFHAYPMVVRVGGMLNAFGPTLGHKVTHPDTGDVTLACEGFNEKHHYDRQTPCDQDYLRKLAKDTSAEAMLRWYGQDVVRALRKRRAFDKAGLFIGDASYLFVPDNPHYQYSDRLRFDEHNHPVSREAYAKMTPEQRERCRWRRCYKLVTLLHTNRQLDFFLFAGLQVLPGRASECPVLYALVDQFVATVGKGVMKRLILDRGFIDGAAIAKCKQVYQIDVLIPLRRDLDIYADAQALFAQQEVAWHVWQAPTAPRPKPARPRPQAVAKRERTRQQTLRQRKETAPPLPPDKTLVKTEIATIGAFRSWSSCTVPLSVVATREHYADGHDKTWFLLDTRPEQDPTESRELYRLRVAVEERYRQLKCFSDLTQFTSRAFSLVVNQVVFISLAYSLLQLYLKRQGRQELNRKTQPRLRQQLLPQTSVNIVYWEDCYGFFETYELLEIAATASEQARRKLAAKSRRRRLELVSELKHPRPE
jgi:hypothetical protein